MSLKFLQKFIRGMSHALEEKPTIEPDDFELEHFLYYHGLAGTSPQNQRKFKDVKADVKLAFNNQSSSQLATTLRLPPLWWEEKLKSIFQEYPLENVVSLLNSELLFHSDWQVRANTANILASLNAEEQIPSLIESVHDTANNTKTAFCHQISALARLGQIAKSKDSGVQEVLCQYLNHKDSWFRVDATNAVCIFAQASALTLDPLLKSLAEPHLLQDYCAVMASKTIKPKSLLTAKASAESVSAGAAMILGLIDAASSTFGFECIKELEGEQCLDLLLKLAEDSDFSSKPYQATVLLALFKLNEFLDLKNKSVATLLNKVKADSLIQKLKPAVLLSEQRSAIILVGELKLADCLNSLLDMLKDDFIFVDETIDSIGKLADSKAAEPLLSLANQLVNIDERTSKTLSAQPLLEDHTPAVKTYWRILKNLESIHTQKVLDFLVRATNDQAPDKRLAALNSMVQVKFALPEAEIAPVSSRLAMLIVDPSLDIRTAAVKGIGLLQIKDEIPRLAQMTAAKEVSLSRQVFQTLSELASAGHKVEVETAVRQKLRSVMDPHLSKKLNVLIESLASH